MFNDAFSRLLKEYYCRNPDYLKIMERLEENRLNMSFNHRLDEVKKTIKHLPLDKLLHHAAMSFMALDEMTANSLELPKNIKGIEKLLNTEKAKKAVNARHDKPGGSRDKAAQIRAIWATGKYTTRDICAEEEYQSLGYKSFGAARRALQNTADPEKIT